MSAAALKSEIKHWERSFKERKRRSPTINDIKAEPEIVEKYRLYKKLTKSGTNTALEHHPDYLPRTLPNARPSTPSPVHHSKRAHGPPTDIEIGTCDATQRARKRLRGAVISPSPRRIGKGPRTTSPNLICAEDEDSDRNGELTVESPSDESVHIEDSPVKKGSNSKDYEVLFEEEPLPPELDLSNKATAKLTRSLLVSDGMESSHMQSVQHSLVPGSDEIETVKWSISTLQQVESNEAIDKRDDLHDYRWKKRKSSASDINSAFTNIQRIDSVSLLPPSPPRDTDAMRFSSSGKALKNDNYGKIKKQKRVAYSSAATDDSHDLDVVELSYHARTRSSNIQSDDEIASSHGFFQLQGSIQDNLPQSNENTEEEIAIDLPEGMRQLLYISSSQRHAREELSLVQAVLKGEPSYRRHSEVWGVGEVDVAVATNTDGEDEWDGEGLSWDVGEW